MFAAVIPGLLRAGFIEAQIPDHADPRALDQLDKRRTLRARSRHPPDQLHAAARRSPLGHDPRRSRRRPHPVPSSTAPAVISATLHDHIKLDALHDQLARAGAIIRKPPFQVSWQPHVHQMEIEDPDGNVLLFWGDPP